MILEASAWSPFFLLPAVVLWQGIALLMLFCGQGSLLLLCCGQRSLSASCCWFVLREHFLDIILWLGITLFKFLNKSLEDGYCFGPAATVFYFRCRYLTQGEFLLVFPLQKAQKRQAHSQPGHIFKVAVFHVSCNSR